MWEATYSTAKEKYGEKRAAKIAWTAIKDRFKKVNGKWVARSSDFEMIDTVHYVFEQDETTVTKSEDGYTVTDYILSGNNKDTTGYAFGDFALKSIASQINESGIVGRLNEDKHERLKQLQKQGLSPEEIEEELNKDTGIKAISAKYENGKLIAKVKIREDLVDEALKYKGVSIEARLPKESIREKTYTQARATGFVFTNNPANPIAGKLD